MAASIQLGTYSLNTATNPGIVTETIQHDSATPIFLDTLEISRQDGSKLISSNYQPKSLTIVGIIRATSQAELEDTIDDFKQNCSVARGNLDLGYAGAYRRYIVSNTSIAVNRAFFHQSFAPFSLTFLVLDPPFAQALTGIGGDLAISEALSVDAKTDQIISSVMTFGGTAAPKPVMRYVIDTATNLSTLKIGTSGKNEQLIIATAFAAGDQMLIDTGALEVTRNGSALGFTGFFPEFEPGSNTMVTQALGSATVDVQRVGADSFYSITNPTTQAAIAVVPLSTTTFPYVELLLQRQPDLLTGTVTLEIQTDNAGVPSGTAVANASIAQSVLTIPENISGWVQFKFATPPSLSSGTTYWIVLKSSSAFFPGGVISWNRFASTGDTMCYSLNGGASFTIGSTNTAQAYKLIKAASGWSFDIQTTYIKRFL